MSFAEGERLCPLAFEECVAASMIVEVSEYRGQKSNDLVQKIKEVRSKVEAWGGSRFGEKYPS